MVLPLLRFLCAGLLLCGAALSAAQIVSTSVSSSPSQGLPPSNETNSFAGSVPAKVVPAVIPLSLEDAIDRGLKQNLGLLLSRADVRSARGQRWQELSALLPHVAATPYVEASKINLAELGLTSFAGFSFPPSIGPFSYLDARANVTQSLLDWKSVNATRAANQNLRSAEYTFKDAHDIVVQAVGYVYFQAIEDEARIETDEAQVKTAQALYDQATDQVSAGTAADIDALRSKVELQTRQQQLIQAKNDFAIQKLTVARVIGLPPAQGFELTDKSPYQPFEGMRVDEALKRAYTSRSDYQAALSNVRSAELSRKAAVAGYFPSLSFGADYGTAGAHPSNATQVYDVHGTLSIPIFTGGKVHGDVQQADATLEQSRERRDNLQAQIESDVRVALLNLQSSADQVNVARSNIDLADQTLTQSRDRFSAGVTDTVEVVQSQESVASAHEQYISSLYSFNVAKISLIRAMGLAEQGVKEYFRGK
ncbi:MAG TPA: TolC family protein [Candidatus Deferrimicrobiaceae bacterium]|nr:TolC family protein [Candidatus Deferrimicrobiaceae bacterium]